MEGKAVQELIRQIKEKELMVKSVCHDNDSGTTKIFYENFGKGKQDPPVQNIQGSSIPNHFWL